MCNAYLQQFYKDYVAHHSEDDIKIIKQDLQNICNNLSDGEKEIIFGQDMYIDYGNLDVDFINNYQSEHGTMVTNEQVCDAINSCSFI